MPQYEFRLPRLYVAESLLPAAKLTLNRGATNYLMNVLRLTAGDEVHVFNGQNGEWLARLTGSRRGACLVVERQVRSQPAPSQLLFAFAPIKHARLDYMIQKAVEMGAGTIQPVLTRFTQVTRVNGQRMRANAVEAAEQCGILAIPAVLDPKPFPDWLAALHADHVVVFCDETAEGSDPLTVLRDGPGGPLALLIGPEGGFHDDERRALLARPRTVRIALGPRILRADTAAVAALALVQAVRGDWR